MSDSDNEYSPKRHSKFQGERSQTTKRHRTEKFVDSRKKRSNSSSSRGQDRSDFRNFEQATKRSKYNDYYQNTEYHNNRSQVRPNVRPRQLLLMPFKTFILSQDDRISESDAIANYNEYKLNFQVEQIENFFNAHKDEEWFRIKYHPVDSKKHNEEQANALKRRCNIFLELLNANKIDCVNLDSHNTNNLLKILDMVVLKLEGGTEEDIATLEKEYLELENKVENVESKTESEEADKTEKEKVKMEKHKTSSICLRNVSSVITQKEIESICSKYDGFIRVWLSDSKPENNWIRQGWATFTKNSDVKEICKNINKLRVKDSELDAVVNEDLANRICLVDGITAEKKVVKSDIQISAKIALHLDEQAGLWLENDEKTETKEENPVLHNLSDYLVEKVSSDEDLTLMPNSEKSDEINFDRDDNLIAVLDKIILYLRIVHSVDYYNHCKYSNEDEMPNRCGILHVRGPPPSDTSKSKISPFLGKEMEAKLKQFLPEKLDETENKLVNLGFKDFTTEIDKFVLKNTIELNPNKWECPLSGKKFKSPDFVRKHIFLKHCNKIEELKENVEFFNNYLRDPKRMVVVPGQPEKQESCVPPRYNRERFARNYNSHPAQVMSAQSASREVIHYRDLDAPPDIEELF